MQNSELLQVTLLGLSLLAQLALVLSVRFFYSDGDNRLEIFNEITLTILFYHMIMLIGRFVDDPQNRDGIGYSIIFFTSLNVIVNLSILGFTPIKSIYRRIKRC